MGKTMAIIFLSLILVFPASGGQIPKGGKKVMIQIGERSDSGRLLAVKADLIVIESETNGEILGFPAADVDLLKIRKGGFGSGALKGGIAAAALTTIGMLAGKSKESNGWDLGLGVPLFIAFTVAGALIGGVIGGLAGSKKYRLAGMEPGKRARILEKLGRSAADPSAAPDAEFQSRVTIISKNQPVSIPGA